MKRWMFESDEDIQEFYEGSKGIRHEVFLRDFKECLEKTIQYRRDLGGHKVDVTVLVARAMCIDCAPSWRYLFPELLDKDWTDINKDGWETDLLLLGFPIPVIDELKEDILEGIEAELRGPFCFDCNRPLPYWEDEESACYLVRQPLAEYIGHQYEEDAVSVGKSLRRMVLDVYGSSCFGCGIVLKRSEVTIDHIVPKAEGGTADIFNLQPLCESCNQEKADQPPVDKIVTLHFPLRPLPSDTYEGWSW